MTVKAYHVNAGTPSSCYGLKDAEENRVLCYAPNNWKTEKGALNWARRHGYKVEESGVKQ